MAANLAASDGHPITFMQFFRHGLGVVVASLPLCISARLLRVMVEPVIGRAAVALKLEPTLRGRLAFLAAGRPMVIDYYASRFRGVAIGDLVVRFGQPASEPRFVELESIEGVPVLAERHLVGLLESATLREAGPPWHRHLALSLARASEWIAFLDRSPSRRA